MSARPTSVLDREHLPYPDVVAVYEMTEQEYLDWDQEGGLADWVDGKVYHYMVASRSHQEIVHFLSSFLGLFGRITGTGRVLNGPYAMRTRPGRSWREPDIMFMAADEYKESATEHGFHGGATLVIEVVSPGSPRRDLVDKLKEYAEAGVREYWVIDPRPRSKRASFFVLDARAGAFVESVTGDDGVFHPMAVPELWVSPEWFRSTEHDEMSAAVAVLGLERVVHHITSRDPMH
ncbi:hypothetical protein AYO38_06360 [bacterium SCGC AG-212-C10]|nr:hypothetical protein AYO38_06360 [bacterium SCGC AG-212-C10]